MANEWKVKFTDDDDADDIQIASFNSQNEANLWIKNQQIQERYDPCGFEVIEGPYREQALSEAEEKQVELSFKPFAQFVDQLDMEDVQQSIIDAVIVFISNTFDVDAQKFKDGNPKLCKKIRSIIPLSKDKSEKTTPIFAVHYPSTDVNLLAVVNVPWMQDKSTKSFFKLGWKLIKKTMKNTPLGMFIKDSSTFLLIPFKQSSDKIVHDSSEKAYLQVAMALLLSDIEFDSLWPTKSIGASFMAYLDFICPSLIDVIGLATFGGASIAARAAKISAKVGAKKAAKAGAKKGIKKLSQKQLKFIAKVSKNAPKSVQKTIKKGHEAIKNAKDASKLSRKMKDNLKGRGESPEKEEKELAESKEQFNPTSYIEEFKDYFGYMDDYEPDKDYSEVYDSLAREIALQMPTDTDAREIEGDAVMLLVKSGDEEGVSAGKALGDCMMHKTKHDEKTLLKKMRDAFLALGKLDSKKQAEQDQLIDESAQKIKIWVDDVRNPPNGYVWLKSVNSFIDYVVEHGLQDVLVIDIDHDAGEYASDGGDYIKILDWLEHMGIDNISIRIHSANPVGVSKMRQIMKKNGWKEVFDIYESNLSREQQVQLLFESIGPSDETFGETWEQLDMDHHAWKMIKDSLMGDDSLNVADVCKVEGKDHFIAIIEGGDNGSLDSQRWLRYLESVKKLIAQMFKHGCGDVWLIDFNNDCLDDVFTLRIGFQLLSSPFSSDGNIQLDEAGLTDKKVEDPKAVGAEDTETKREIVDTLKDASHEFEKNAANNDPEQFAKIKVAFDDLTAAVGDYDFKKKRVLKEIDNSTALDEVFAKIKQDIEAAGAMCNRIEQGQDGIVRVDGKFEDTLPLERLILWYLDGHWHEGTKCRNRWREVATAIFDKHLPNGVLAEQESQDGAR